VTQNLDIAGAGNPIWGSGNLVRQCLEDAYKVCSGLAESWEVNPDFTQYTFKIRENVLWHDGTRFTVEDAKFWLDLVYFGAKSQGKTRRPAFWASDYGLAEKVEVLPGSRVRITLKSRGPVILETAMLAIYTMGLPRHLVQPLLEQGRVDFTPQDIGFVGTGPFKMLKYEKGSRVQLRRSERYWEKDAQGRQLPFMDGIDFAVLADPAAMHAAMRVGRLDGGVRAAGYYITREQRPGYVKDLGDQVWFAQIPSGGSVGLGLGLNLLKKGPWQDIKVRRAISLWMDRQAAVEAVHGGEGYVGSIMAPFNPFSSPDFLTWPGVNPATKAADRAEAKRLMAEAGYSKGFAMTYNCNRTYLDRCQYFQGQLSGLAIDLKFDLLDATQWTASNLTLDYDAVSVGATVAPLPEAQEFQLTRYSLSPSSLVKHEDQRVADFFDRLRAATSFDQRVKIWREFERYMILDQVYLFTYAARNNVTPYRSYVKGMVIGREGSHAYVDFATVWLDK
jgi:ABC-type transport system substrate-binding protein